MTTPSEKPICRPIRRINSEAGIVVSMVAENCNANGNVDKAGSAANDCPTRAVTVMLIDMADIESA